MVGYPASKTPDFRVQPQLFQKANWSKLTSNQFAAAANCKGPHLSRSGGNVRELGLESGGGAL
jgi:hypothetical protein